MIRCRGKSKPRVDDCSPDALARLAHGGVGQPDEREGRKAAVDVDLDVDRNGIDAAEGKGSRPGEHRPKLGGVGSRVARRCADPIAAIGPIQRHAVDGDESSRRRPHSGASARHA